MSGHMTVPADPAGATAGPTSRYAQAAMVVAAATRYRRGRSVLASAAERRAVPNLPDGGAAFLFTLPLVGAPLMAVPADA